MNIKLFLCRGSLYSLLPFTSICSAFICYDLELSACEWHAVSCEGRHGFLCTYESARIHQKAWFMHQFFFLSTCRECFTCVLITRSFHRCKSIRKIFTNNLHVCKPMHIVMPLISTQICIAIDMHIALWMQCAFEFCWLCNVDFKSCFILNWIWTIVSCFDQSPFRQNIWRCPFAGAHFTAKHCIESQIFFSALNWLLLCNSLIIWLSSLVWCASDFVNFNVQIVQSIKRSFWVNRFGIIGS